MAWVILFTTLVIKLISFSLAFQGNGKV